MRYPFLIYIAVVFLFLPEALLGQGKEVKLLKSDLSYLASDALEGRLAGSANERKAGEFIKQRFEKIGLEPLQKGNSFFHGFTFNAPVKYSDDGNYMRANGEPVELEKDFYVLPVSGNAEIRGGVVNLNYGISDPSLDHDDFEGKTLKKQVLLVNLESPDGIHPHSKFKAYHHWRVRFDELIAQSPKAIIFYNSPEELTLKALRKFNNIKPVDIPVVHVSAETARLIKNGGFVNIGTQLIREELNGRNVVGAIYTGSEKTVVIGAHYDHLGYGEFGNSLYMGDPMIHNGADDNASGVALMLGLAKRLYKQRKRLEHNYIFIAFSAEELGLLGSKAFVNADLLSSDKVHYMMNFDMVGRLNEEAELGIFGSGTSSKWESSIKKLDTTDFQINRSPSGMGSSDHTSFYLSGVPVVHFFSGTHEDYHKPSDDEEKINYDGISSILDFSFELCKVLDEESEMDFKKTKSGNTRKAPSFKVTLGIIPDYYGKADGLKIDGVSPGKPADRAGMLKGDVITQLGEVQVTDMMTYMEALRQFDKGAHTTAVIQRNGKALTIKIEF